MRLICNLFIFTITLFFTVRFFRKDGAWDIARGKNAFRFFTVQSNVLCAAAALLLCVVPSQRWSWLLKYIGTAAVTVTLRALIVNTASLTPTS